MFLSSFLSLGIYFSLPLLMVSPSLHLLRQKATGSKRRLPVAQSSSPGISKAVCLSPLSLLSACLTASWDQAGHDPGTAAWALRKVTVPRADQQGRSSLKCPSQRGREGSQGRLCPGQGIPWVPPTPLLQPPPVRVKVGSTAVAGHTPFLPGSTWSQLGSLQPGPAVWVSSEGSSPDVFITRLHLSSGVLSAAPAQASFRFLVCSNNTLLIC